MSAQADLFSGPRLRATSIQAYREIKAQGLLGAARERVYSSLFELGSATAGEITAHLGPGATRNNVASRLNELSKLGIVREVEPRSCRVSGRRALVREIVPGAMPVKREAEPRALRIDDARHLARELSTRLGTSELGTMAAGILEALEGK